MNILGIIGSINSTKTKISLNSLNFNEDVNYEVIDLSNYNLKFRDGRAYNEYNEDTTNLINKMMESDGIIFGIPIYQASMPGVLKNLFDLLPLDALRDKPVGLIITSGSDKHFLVSEFQIIPVLNYLKADVINKYVYITQREFGVNKIDSDDIFMRLEALEKEIIKRSKAYKAKMESFNF